MIILLLSIVIFVGFTLLVTRQVHTASAPSEPPALPTDIGLTLDEHPRDGLIRYHGDVDGMEAEVRFSQTEDYGLHSGVLTVTPKRFEIPELMIHPERQCSFELATGNWLLDSAFWLETPNLLRTAFLLDDEIVRSQAKILLGEALRLQFSANEFVARQKDRSPFHLSQSPLLLEAMVTLLHRAHAIIESEEWPEPHPRFGVPSRELGLQAVGSPDTCFVARGELSGQRVRVAKGFFDERAGPHLKFLAEIDVNAPFREGSLSSRSGAGPRLRELIGVDDEDVLVGEASIDPAWIVQGDPDFLRGVFAVDAVTDGVHALLEHDCFIRFDTGQVEITRLVVPESGEEYREFVEASSRLSGHLEHAIRYAA